MNEVFLVIFSGIVALSTIAYAWLTRNLVTETRKMREVQTEPSVMLYPQISDRGFGSIDLVIHNAGQGSARNIRFTFRGDPTYFDPKHPFDKLPVIEKGLTHLGPGQSFRFLLGWLFGESFAKASKEPWTVLVTYQNSLGHLKQAEFSIDFGQFAGLIIGEGAPLEKIAKHLESLDKEFRSISSGFHKLNVVTQTKEEQRKEWREAMDEAKRGPETNREVTPTTPVDRAIP